MDGNLNKMDLRGENMETKLVVFKGKEIRRALHADEWWFSVSDVVEALTDSNTLKK
jgi:DNA-damage-inducible protein D